MIVGEKGVGAGRGCGDKMIPVWSLGGGFKEMYDKRNDANDICRFTLEVASVARLILRALGCDIK